MLFHRFYNYVCYCVSIFKLQYPATYVMFRLVLEYCCAVICTVVFLCWDFHTKKLYKFKNLRNCIISFISFIIRKYVSWAVREQPFLLTLYHGWWWMRHMFINFKFF